MGATRNLLGAVLVGLAGGPAFGQPLNGYPYGGTPEPIAQTAGVAAAPALAATAAGAVPPPPAADPTPTAVLTGQPASAYPPGTVVGPWVGSSPAGCCGPVGGNGPLAYELYLYTGPSLVVGGGSDFSAATKTGWMIGGGGRTLMFNTPRDAAWVIDLGLSYTYNGGRMRERVLNVFTPAPLNQQTNEPTGPDQVNSFFLRGLHRTSFNFALGRDWFLNGPGNLGAAGGWGGGPNWRFGTELGGRWGSGHVDLLPVADQFNYLRRSGVFHGVFLGAHVDCEVPVGGYVLFTGFKTQWGYDWTNYIPPEDGDIQSVNLLWTIGWRF